MLFSKQGLKLVGLSFLFTLLAAGSPSISDGSATAGAGEGSDMLNHHAASVSAPRVSALFNGQSYSGIPGFSFGIYAAGTYYGSGIIYADPHSTVYVNISAYPNIPYTCTLTLTLVGETFGSPYSSNVISITDWFLDPLAHFTMPVSGSINFYLEFDTNTSGTAASGTVTAFN